MRANNGSFIISRSIYDSEIWTKPSDWIKIWIYLLGNVNFQDNNLFKRGENLFKYDIISMNCGCSYKTVEHCMKFLKERNQIGITRTSRGAIISVTKYDEYQGMDNYRESKGNQKGIKRESDGDSIIEERNKEIKKEGNNIIISSKEDTTKSLKEKKEYGDPIINSIIDTIKLHNNGIIDGTIANNRKYGKMLRDKIDKIKGFNGDHISFLSTLIERTDQYSISKTTSCESIYYNLASLVAKIKTTHVETKQKEEDTKPKTWRLQPTTSITTT